MRTTALARNTLVIVAVLLGGVMHSTASHAQASEPIVGGPCEGCEAVFDGLPEKLTSHARIAPRGERGEPLRIEGTVRNAGGNPVPGIIVYAYQTDAKGIYPPDEAAKTRYGRRHGRLRAWAKTDSLGRYRFDTIRPASYPGTSIPQHVHMHVIEPNCCTYYIDDVIFTDDPKLSPAERRSMSRGRGGPGVATPRREGSGPWRVVRDIVLGAGVPGHPRAAKADS